MRFGRPEKPVPADFGEIVLQWQEKALDISQVLALCDLSAATLYKRLREHRIANGTKRELGQLCKGVLLYKIRLFQENSSRFVAFSYRAYCIYKGFVV